MTMWHRQSFHRGRNGFTLNECSHDTCETFFTCMVMILQEAFFVSIFKGM